MFPAECLIDHFTCPYTDVCPLRRLRSNCTSKFSPTRMSFFLAFAGHPSSQALLAHLQWLPVDKRITFKTAALVYKSLVDHTKVCCNLSPYAPLSHCCSWSLRLQPKTCKTFCASVSKTEYLHWYKKIFSKHTRISAVAEKRRDASYVTHKK